MLEKKNAKHAISMTQKQVATIDGKPSIGSIIDTNDKKSQFRRQQCRNTTIIASKNGLGKNLRDCEKDLRINGRDVKDQCSYRCHDGLRPFPDVQRAAGNGQGEDLHDREEDLENGQQV